MARLVVTTTTDREGADLLTAPRDDLVLEREVEPGVFEAVEGPFRRYRRTVTTEAAVALDCPGPAATGDPVLVGFAWPEGGQALDQPDVGEAARATVSYANDCLGGIGGRPVELVECPEGEDAASVAACANDFIDAGAVAGGISATQFGDSMAGPLGDAGIPYYSPTGAGAELLDENGYVWGPGAAGSLGGAAAYAEANGLDSVALVVVEDVAAQLTAFATPAFDAAGVDFTSVPVPLGTPDMTPQLRTALDDSPEALAILGDETLCISFLQALEALAPENLTTMVILPCLADNVAEAVGADVLEGKVVIGTNDSASDDPEAELYRAVMQEYAPDVDAFGFASFGYTSILSVVRAADGIEGEITPASMAEAFGQDRDVALPVGAGTTFNCSETPIAQPAPLVAVCAGESLVGTIQDGAVGDIEVFDIRPLFGGS